MSTLFCQNSYRKKCEATYNIHGVPEFMIRKNKKVKSLIRTALFGLLFSSFNASLVLSAEENGDIELTAPVPAEECYSINFNDVPVVEFIRFVSKISTVNFIFDNKELNFNITLSSGKPVCPENIVKALLKLLRTHDFDVLQEDNYYVIHRIEEGKEKSKSLEIVPAKPIDGLLASTAEIQHASRDDFEFFVYKLQYHEGAEIEMALKKIAADMHNQNDAPVNLIKTIQSLQWVKATNSLLCSGDQETLGSLKKLVDTLDIPLRQVFIEVLVIETDVKRSLDFGLQWAASGQFQNRLGVGVGNFAPGNQNPSFAGTMQQINGTNTPTGLGQIPLVPGFDVGVIGDIIMHKGKSFLSLGSLVSALQMDGDSTIVLNQKIITQDNKNSTIFVGDNLPFTGSVVSTVGQGQQTTANIEYRDIGVSLSITPRLGEGDVITLDLNEEITESLDDPQNSSAAVNGIRTTKTNMMTHVHVPDKNFLVLSGMVRNSKAHHKAGLPCLGGLPIIGAAFSKTRKQDEKRNMIIFVRPHIIHSFEDYRRLTMIQESVYQLQAAPGAFSEAVDVLPAEEVAPK